MLHYGRFGWEYGMDWSSAEKQLKKDIQLQITLEIESVGQLADLMKVLRHRLAENDIETYEGKFRMPTVGYRKDDQHIEERFPTWTQAIDRALVLLVEKGREK